VALVLITVTCHCVDGVLCGKLHGCTSAGKCVLYYIAIWRLLLGQSTHILQVEVQILVVLVKVEVLTKLLFSSKSKEVLALKYFSKKYP